MVGQWNARGVAGSVVGDFEMASMRRGERLVIFLMRARHPVNDGEVEGRRADRQDRMARAMLGPCWLLRVEKLERLM